LPCAQKGFFGRSVRLRDHIAGLLLVLWKILMPLASWLSRACIPRWLRSRLAWIALVRGARLVGFARLTSVGVFRIASLRPNGHCEILQFFSDQTQFVDDLFSYLVFHMAPLRILHSLTRQFLLARRKVSTVGSLANHMILIDHLTNPPQDHRLSSLPNM
jgi:hypothetical protein